MSTTTGGAGDAAAVDVVVADLLDRLDAVQARLAVSTEEVRVQQRQIDGLVADGAAAHSALEHVAALLPVLAVTTDPDGLVLSANPVAARLLGVPAEALVGTPLTAAVRLQDRATVQAAALGARRSGEAQVVTAVLAPAVPADVRLDLTISPHGDDGAQVLFWYAVPRDGGDGHPELDRALVAALSRLAALPVADASLRDVLTGVATVAGQAIPGTDRATVTVGDPLDPVVLASDSHAAQLADAAQVEAGEGPSVQAWAAGSTVATADVVTDPRWPRLGPVAAAAGLRGVLGVPVPGEGPAPVGVLSLYVEDVDLPTSLPHMTSRAETLAAAVGAVLLHHRRVDALREEAGQLRAALTSRSEIDQAKGIIMARLRCGPDEAFAHLVSVSRDHNVKLREVARRLVGSVEAAPES